MNRLLALYTCLKEIYLGCKDTMTCRLTATQIAAPIEQVADEIIHMMKKYFVFLFKLKHMMQDRV